jgi:O-methyltransferase involved in polyketide biosynthesis
VPGDPVGAVDLGGVPETALWTLYHRASEARRADAVLDDPLAVELVERIDYPFEARFGTARLGQWQALRARCFDREVRRFLDIHPGGTVVALGEGLETQFWRVDDALARWLTVDVREVIELRQRLLPRSRRLRVLACSALDPRWLDEIDPSRGVLVTAQGLFMYFERDAVHGLVEAIAQRLPHQALVFDAVPRWLSERSRRGELATSGYRPPPWPWGLDPDERRRLASLAGVERLRTLVLPRGRGLVHGALLPVASRLPGIRTGLLAVLRADFA